MRRLIVLALVLALSRVSHADVKLVQTSDAGGELFQAGKARAEKAGGAAIPENATTTVYFKGDKIRTESKGRTTLFDGKRLLLLNAEKKTYQVLPLDGMANPMAAMMDIKSEATVKASGKTKVILGKTAKQYLLTITMNLGLKPGMLPQKEGAPKTEAPKIPPIVSKGEIWAVEFPGITANPSQMMGGMATMPGMKEIQAKLKTIKGIGLETSMNQELMGRTMAIKTATKSISEAPLPTSLFEIPKGWKQVPFEAPSMGGFGMPGR